MHVAARRGRLMMMVMGLFPSFTWGRSKILSDSSGSPGQVEAIEPEVPRPRCRNRWAFSRSDATPLFT